jgi:hypothetical protein
LHEYGECKCPYQAGQEVSAGKGTYRNPMYNRQTIRDDGIILWKKCGNKKNRRATIRALLKIKNPDKIGIFI